MIPFTTSQSPPHSPSSSAFQVTEDPLTSLPHSVEPDVRDITPTPSLHFAERDEKPKVENSLVDEDEDDTVTAPQRKMYVPLHGFFVHLIG